MNMDEKVLNFIARTSHSIRTPLTAVLGVSEIMLRDSALPAHVAEAFEKIHDSGKIMLGIANDLLDLRRVETGELPIANAPYNVAELIQSITALHQVHLGSRKIAYKVSVDPQIPATLIGDELRIKQILDNLLANAFKFTENGTIELKATWQATSETNYTDKIAETEGNLVLQLNDTGLGYDVDKSKVGLGHAIVQSIVSALNAKISIDSEPGMGTRVKVTIPQKSQTAAPKSQKVIPERMPYARALVVDDVESCLFIVKGLLGFYEITADLVGNGEAAIEKIKNNSYDIIFMDHIMPGIDGISAAQIIRERGCATPMVALTANAIFGQETEYLQSGFDAYLSKPIDMHEFDEILHRYVRDKQPDHVIDAVAQQKRTTRATEDIKEDETHTRVTTKLRQDFVKKQRDVYTEITIALGNGKPETARWHVDTVKNMAGMIGEPVLTKIASDVSNAIAAGEIPTRLLEMLNQELTTVLDAIPEEVEQTNAALTESEIRILLADLHHLLDTDCAESMFLVEKLKLIPETGELIKHIENFDFPAALNALAVLRKDRRYSDGCKKNHSDN